MPDELFLIDGNSLAYRAFFALPESIATSTGMPTNAIFGFASMLVKILTDYGPKATVVVWDAGDTGRKAVYAEYKAQRSSRPDLLKEQWPHLEPLVDAFGYRNLRVEGYEADDVIASIAERAKHADPPIPVMVVTGDRDAYQLVDDGVRIMTTSRGITDTQVYDRDGVVDRYGIPPELVPDFIGLKGDTSDNIPGVPGIGDKTAAELLQRFGSLENVLEHIDEISGAKRKQNLTKHADDARISKQLATAKRDIPIDVRPRGVRRPPSRTARSSATRSASSSCASRCAGSRRRSATPTPPPPRPSGRAGAHGDASARGHRRAPSRPCRTPRSALAVQPPETPEGALFAADSAWRFGAYADGAKEVLIGDCRTPEDTRRGARHATGDRPRRQVAAARSRRTSSTTPRSAPTCSSPPGARTRSASCTEERGFATDTSRTGRRPTRCSPARSPKWQREEIRARGLTDLMRRGRAPARADPAQDGDGGTEARHRAARRTSRRASRPRLISSSVRSSISPARSSRSARPSSWRRSCSASSGL